MAELPQIPTARNRSATDYQPVAGLVIAAGFFTTIFVLAAMLMIFVALKEGKPIPTSWLLPPAILCFFLACAGAIQVRRSEESRTGLKVAHGCWWISAISAVGLFGATFADGFAKTSDLDAKGNEWFALYQKEDGWLYALRSSLDHLKQGIEIQDATTMRVRYPETNAFEEARSTQFLIRAGKDIDIKKKGTEWTAQEKGYDANCLYSVRTPEGEAEMNLQFYVRQIQGQEMWMIRNPDQQLRGLKPSAYGKNVMELQYDGAMLVNRWLVECNSKIKIPNYLATYPADDRAKSLSFFETMTLAGGGATVFLPATSEFFPESRKEWARSYKGPPENLTTDDLFAKNFFRRPDGVALSPEQVEKYRAVWKRGSIINPYERGPGENLPIVQLTADSATLYAPVMLINTPGKIMRGRLILKATNTELLAKLRDLRTKCFATDGLNVPYEPLPVLGSPKWQIEAIESNLEEEAPPERKKG